MRLGIDLGTTRTVVAAADHGNFPVVHFECAFGDTHSHVPTLLARRGSELRTGHAAAAVLDDASWSASRHLKRVLGQPAGGRAQVVLGDETLDVFTALVSFAADLRAGIVQSLGLSDEALEVMLAVPARASSAQRFLTMDAFRAAGFDVLGLMNEPAAAATEYAHRHAKTLTSRRERVLVYDLGGGTFDVTLVDLGGDEHKVLANGGDPEIGGERFDDALLALLVEGGTAAERTRWLEACRGQKEGLRANTRKLAVDLDGTLHQTTTAAYYNAVAPLVERTRQVAHELVGDGLDKVAGVYVVGGGSQLPVVARMLRETFGRRVRKATDPSASTAIGLAIAASGAGVEISDQLGRTFGVFRERDSGRDVMFDAILPSGFSVGAERVRRYRPAHNIGHFRFAECGVLSDDGTPIGELVPTGELLFPFDSRLQGAELGSEPVTAATVQTVVEERYSVAESGRIEVVIRDLNSGYEQRLALG